MSAKAQEWPVLTANDVEHALELSSRDPDAPHDENVTRGLVAAATKGVVIGLAWGGPKVSIDAAPDSMVEVGSDSHADFVH